ncbi:MAG: LptF/LptG family permease [Steroidobacteraceae bacterium]
MPIPRFVPDRLDLYTLRSLAGPLALSLGVLLLAQLLERLLRLFDMAAASGAALSVVLTMAATLVPHYLGLAVPTAFFAAIFMAVARLSDDNELDVMLATGRSIARVATPYFAVAALLGVFNFYLFGYLQPLSRYAYHVAAHTAAQAAWNARVEDNRFVRTVHGFTLTADAVGSDGRQLQGVFVERSFQGREEVITAKRGRLVSSTDGTRLLLELSDGMILRDNADGGISTMRFAEGRIDEDFAATPPPYRARGQSVRELTLPELWHGRATGSGNDAASEDHERAGELQGRLARILLPPLLPLLALPLGMAVKRGRRAHGTVFAVLALLALNQSLQFGESLAESGRAAALPAVWTPFALFGLLGIWLFRSSLRAPGDNPVVRAVAAIEVAFEGLHLMQKKRKS